MSFHPDISRGDSPIPSTYDIYADKLVFRIGNKSYRFDSNALPFTLKEKRINGLLMRCADKALILKHANG